ncbi:MAG: type II and III secretion system protein family protein [Candidatus Brocadiales bacterium]
MLIDSVEQLIDRVSVTEPAVVDAIIISPQQILLNGKSPGLTTFIIWDKSGNYTIYDVAVQRDVSLLIERLHEIDENIRVEVQAANDSVILWGKVANGAIITKAVTVASAFYGGTGLTLRAGPGGTILKSDELPMEVPSSGIGEAGKNVARTWNVSEGAIITTENGKVISFLEVAEPQQVELRVRIVEINRSALKELGINLRTTLSSLRFFTIPMGIPLAAVDNFQSNLTNPATGIFDSHDATLRALEERDLATMLAEPNLVVISGQQGSFLAGGEFPYLERTFAGGIQADSVRWKDFGVRLDFVPEVKQSGIINLKVSSGVSAIDREIAVNDVPGLKINRAETTVELREGETLIIGGLISRDLVKQLSQVPWIGDIPYIGALFRSTRYLNEETELIIMITPILVKPFSPGQAPALPEVMTELHSDYELFLMGHLEGSGRMEGPFGHSF